LRAPDTAVAAEREIAAPLIAVAGRRQCQHHQAIHARIVPGVIRRDRLEPMPSIHTESESVPGMAGAQPRQRLAHAAAGQPRRLLVGNFDTVRARPSDVARLIGHVDAR
jgi:hypothetical protein